MWVPSLSLFLYLVSFAPALSSPIDQGSIDRVSQLNIRNIDLGNTTVLRAPSSFSYRPPVPYDWPVPSAAGSYVKFTRYGAEMLEENGYIFMYVYELRFQVW